MSNQKVVQIRKKSGLEKIIKSKNGATLNPLIYSTETKNAEDGTLEGPYRGKQILGTKHFISPIWSDLKKQWSWSGTAQDLTRIISGMKLRYPKKHPKAGMIIEPGDNPSERLTNMQDEVFTHPDLYGKFYMQGGRVSLTLSDPKQEFLYLCYKGDSNTDDKSGDEKKSKFITAGAKYEIISPRNENVKAKRSADKEIEAITLLAKMNGNEDRLRAIARVMTLPQYSDTTDANGVFLLLMDMAAKNTEISGKYGDRSYQDRFIELAGLTDEELNVQDQVMTAKLKGILRRRTGHYLFNGEKIDGMRDDTSIIKYFQNPSNQEHYIKLLEILESYKK